MLNPSIRYIQNELYCDDIPVKDITYEIGTPAYIYSLKRILDNLQRIRQAFAGVAIGRAPGLRMNRATIALVGAAILLRMSPARSILPYLSGWNSVGCAPSYSARLTRKL